MTHEASVRPGLGSLPRPDRVACDPEQDDEAWPYDDHVIEAGRRSAGT